MNYKLLVSDSPTELETAVRIALAQGFQPLGSVSMVASNTTGTPDYPQDFHCRYAQALTKQDSSGVIIVEVPKGFERSQIEDAVNAALQILMLK